MTDSEAATKCSGRADTDSGPKRFAESRESRLLRISEALAASPWVQRIAQLGYAAKGFLYIIVGSTAALAATGVGGRVRGLRGALDFVAGHPFGRVGIALVAAGLAGFILRRLIQIFVPPEGDPKLSIMRVLRPVGHLFSGLGHVGILLTAVQIALGWHVKDPRGDTRMPDWMTLFADRPFGGWLVLIAGLVIVGVAVFYFYMALTTRFRIDLLIEGMSEGWRKIVLLAGRIGYAARGAAFLVMGGVLIYAGARQGEINGFGGAVETIEAIPFGTVLLAIIAVGFAAYGLYLIFVAKFLRLIASW